MRVRTVVDLGLAIRDRRRVMRVSQAELARRAGVSRQWILAVEKGRPGAELGLVLRTLRALGLPLHLGPRPPAETKPPQRHAEFNDPPIDLDALLSARPDSGKRSGVRTGRAR
jgi:HTH-type transcriptional regulator/antitoxin HipB